MLPGLPVFDPSGEISEKIAKKNECDNEYSLVNSVWVREKQVV